MTEIASHTDPKAHGLQHRIVYGPLRSRRYGVNLGVNLQPPGEKRCEWNCVYCQLGTTAPLAFLDRAGYPAPEAVHDALVARAGTPGIETLVVCGNGEPTLHPEFPAVVDALRAARDAAFPGVPLVCLTNGSALWRPDVVAALRRLDEVAVKLDAGSCALLARLNLPQQPACVTHLVRGIRRLHGGVVQTCLVEGRVSNATAEALAAWRRAVARALPRRIDLYTLARPTPSGKFRPIPDSQLRTIAERTRDELEIPVRAFGLSGLVFPEVGRSTDVGSASG